MDSSDRNIFDIVRAEFEEELHDEDDSGPEMSDEDEFVPCSDEGDSESETSDSDDSGDEVAARNPEVSTSQEQQNDGSVLQTVLYPAKDGIVWRAAPYEGNAQTAAANVCNLPANQIPGTGSANTPTECFELFITPNIVRTIVKYTNDEGVRQRGDNWVATDVVEIRALLGILIFLGAQKQSKVSLNTIWKPLVGQDFVRATMSRNRCFQLLQTLRFDQKETRRQRRVNDKLAPISDIYGVYSANLQKHYIPGVNCTVDEQLIPFRGRCSFIQYMPSKPAKYGLKLFWICDSETYYPLKSIIYTGKGSCVNVPGQGLGHSVVMTLSLPYQNRGRNITMDNYFTDLSLGESLLKRRTTIVGTVKRNKRFLPAVFKAKKSLKLNESLFGFTRTTALVTYQGHKHKNVCLLSTQHDKPVTAEGERKKPDIVLDYNMTKGGVDTMDQMCLNYTSKRQTKRWPLVIFNNMLDTSILAMGVIYRIKFPQDRLVHMDRRAELIRSVAKELMRDHMQRRCEQLTRAARPLRTLMKDCLQDMGLIVDGPGAAATGAESRKRGRCGLCHWKLQKKGTEMCEKCHTFLCKEHKTVKKVVLCVNCVDSQ